MECKALSSRRVLYGLPLCRAGVLGFLHPEIRAALDGISL
jgi:hypothetical protein